MAKKIVEYEIEENGDCDNCKARCFSCCQAFSKLLVIGIDKNFQMTKREQCQTCKDFLAAEAKTMSEAIYKANKATDICEVLSVEVTE
jgi:hypothetical protein